jgi:hypothetical protein
MRILKLAAFLLVVALTTSLSHAQPVGAQIDTAPAPSARFPAPWYAGTQWTSTQAPVTGAAYTATLVTTYTMPASAASAMSVNQSSMKYRDAAGRTRTEQPLGPLPTPEGTQGAEQRKEVEVNDVVTHCMFHWGEPWTGTERSIATVSCFRTLYFSPWDTSWGTKAQVPSETTSFGRTIKTEPLGRKTINGLEALGTRMTTTTSTPANSGSPQQMVMERWWSPAINEVVWFGPATPQFGLPTFELRDIHPGDPDPSLFYPPVNYRIVKQGDPVP